MSAVYDLSQQIQVFLSDISLADLVAKRKNESITIQKKHEQK